MKLKQSCPHQPVGVCGECEPYDFGNAFSHRCDESARLEKADEDWAIEKAEIEREYGIDSMSPRERRAR